METIILLLATLFGFVQSVGLGEYLTYQDTRTGEVYTIEFHSTESWQIWHTCELYVYEGNAVVPGEEVAYLHLNTQDFPLIIEDQYKDMMPLPQIRCEPGGGNPVAIMSSTYYKTLLTSGQVTVFSHALVLPVVFSTGTTPPIIIDDEAKEAMIQLRAPEVITDTLTIETPLATEPITDTLAIEATPLP